MNLSWLCLAAGLIGLLSCVLADVKTTNIELRMPEVKPQVPDTYLCVPMKMNATATYLVGYVPHAHMETAHHMLIYGCAEPGHRDRVWNCGEMSPAMAKGDYPFAPTCQEGSKIVYAWASDAPRLQLPKDVGFKVGGDTDVQWLVLQVHYKDVTKFIPPKNGVDVSGITLVTTEEKMPKRAGVYLMGTDGMIPKDATVYMETACPFKENVVIHPFAFRAHTHTLGKVVSGYRVRDGVWTEIGRVNPRLPQMFYNATTKNVTVKSRDILAARCTMKNDLGHDIAIGNTQNDEMCNFYIMYYVNGDHIMESDYCFSPGPPQWYWGNSALAKFMNMDGVPRTASIRPGTTELIEEDIPEAIQQSAGLFEDEPVQDGDEFDDVSIEELIKQIGKERMEELLSQALPENDAETGPETDYRDLYEQNNYLEPFPRR